jgi:5'-nucleotidase/UDP-sugar diphosphatase
MIKSKKYFLRTLCAALFVAGALFAGCATGGISNYPPLTDGKSLPHENGVVYELVVLHTNDHHGSTLASSAKEGGLAERATFVNSVKQAHANVLILDAGDINTGTALSNMFDAEPDIRAYDLIGYRAVAVGNHEFDKPFPTLEKQIAESTFDFIAANIVRSNGRYLDKPYIIQDYTDSRGNGFRVAVIGLTTRRSLVVARPDSSLKFLPEIDAAKTMVKYVRNVEKADVVIICGHIGDVSETDGQTTSVALAKALLASSLPVDLIIDGHSHSKFEEAKIVGGIPIVTANEWGKYMGEAVLKIQNGRTIDIVWKPVHITTAEFPPDAATLALLAPYVEKADASLKEVVMKTSDEFIFGNRLPRYRETAAGDLVCDAFNWYVRTKLGIESDFAITNGGGIRAALPKGDVTREAIKTMLPFDNWLFVVKLPGNKVLELFDFIPTQNQGAGGFAQVSKEVKYTLTYDAEGKNGKITGVTIGGKPVDPKKTYTVVTNDYMAGGGDGYTALQSKDMLNTSMWLSDVIVDYAKTLPQPVRPATDGRIMVIGGTTP